MCTKCCAEKVAGGVWLVFRKLVMTRVSTGAAYCGSIAFLVWTGVMAVPKFWPPTEELPP